MNKKEVKALLDMLKVLKKVGRDKTDLNGVFVKDNMLYATNGYAWLEFPMDGDCKYMAFDDIERWYKLAGARDYLKSDVMEDREKWIEYEGLQKRLAESLKTHPDYVKLDTNLMKIVSAFFEDGARFELGSDYTTKIYDAKKVVYLMGMKD